MDCPNCKAKNPYEAKFCMNCGTSLRLTCPNCQTGNVLYAKFCIECGSALQQSSKPATEIVESSIQKLIPKSYAEKLETARMSQTMKGERRIVSILFCDVKGSTEMAEKLDPEEWAEIMNQAFEYLISPIYLYEGTLARLMGDSVLAFFGAPIAHEDDAQRAILAGLEIIRGIQPFKEQINQKFGLDFNVRIGINTGLVVVGGVGSDMFMEYTALGDAINIASRMEQTAQPGTIQVGEDTYKQVRGFFEFEKLEGIEVKGKSEPVEVYRVLDLKEKPTTGRGLHDVAQPLIGRSVELDTFRHAIKAVEKGRGQVLCLIGESGLGKTRLLAEANNLWGTDLPAEQPFGKISLRWNQVSCLSYESSRPYGLVQRLIRNFIGVSENSNPEQVRQNLMETMSMLGREIHPEWLDLFEIMLGIKEQTTLQELSGERLKQKIYSEMLLVLELLIEDRPTVIAVDDLHWSDTASAEFLVHLFKLADRQPILFLCSMRPHHTSPAWMLKQAAETNFAHRYLQINLSPLSSSESNELLDHLLAGAELPHTTRRMILMKAEGNPFYMEEVVRGLRDEKQIVRNEEDGKWQLNTLLDSVTIPDNLHSVITARIDRLDETAKNVLQMASVVGRNFHYQVLGMINNATDDLSGELVKMQRMGLIVEVARDPELEYSFRQALTHETAYQTILLKHRREYHRRVGEALIELNPGRIEEYSSLLGYHFYQARDPRALQYYQMEGDAALRLYANVEAIDSYTKAIEVAKWNDDLNLETLDVLFSSLGRAYELNSQFQEALAKYREFEQIALRYQDKKSELKALTLQALIYSVPSSELNIELGHSIVEKAEKIAESINDREALAKIYWISMNLNRFQRSLKDAQKIGEKAIALARELNLDEQLAYSLNDAAHAYNMNGLMKKAKEVSLEAVELWKKLDNLPMLTDCLAGLAAICVYTGEFEEAYSYSDQAYEISQKINNVWGQAYSRYAIGLVDIERGDVGVAIDHLLQSIRDSQASRFSAGELLSRAILSVVYAELGAYQLAIDSVEGQGIFDLESQTISWTFFLGASLVSRARAGHIEKAEKIIDQFQFGEEDAHHLAWYFYMLGQCYLEIAKEDYKKTITLAKALLSTLKNNWVNLFIPELLLIMGIASTQLGHYHEAESQLRDAMALAEQLGSKKTLWQISYYLGKCALLLGNQFESEEYFQRSQEIVLYIIDHIEDDDLRKAFLSKKEVKDLFTIIETLKL